MEYIGLDVHKQYSVACKLNDETGEIKHSRLNNSRTDFEALFSGSASPRVVLEAGRSSYMVYDTIEDLVSDIQMANPSQVKAIAWAAVKTDKVDAETLAKLLKADIIPTSYIRSRPNRAILYQLRQRMFFVKLRGMVKNRIHALLDRQSEEVRSSKPKVSDLFGKLGRSWLDDLKLPGTESRLLKEMLSLLDFLVEQSRKSDKQVNDLFRQDPVAQRLATIPGIGKFLSVLIRAEIDDIDRFRDESRLYSYAGLAPTTSSSGGKTHHGKLIKSCNGWLKWALIEAVSPATKSSFILKNRYTKLARHKPNNVAKAATARMLLTLVYKIWKQKRVYTKEKPYSGNQPHRAALKIA
jgi:transposase